MDPVSTLKIGAGAVSLVSALAKLVKDVKAKANATNQASLGELLARLQIDGVRLSRDLENRISGLAERAFEYGLNPQMSLQQQLRDLSWYDVLTRSRLKTFREDCASIYRQLTSFIDDATALLLCQKDQQVASTAFLASLDTKRQLDSLFMNEQLPLGKLLDGMLATAERVSAELQAA